MSIPNSEKEHTCEVWTQLHLKQLLREAPDGSFQSIYLNRVSITAQHQKLKQGKEFHTGQAQGFQHSQHQTLGMVKILKHYQHFYYQITNVFSPPECLILSEPPAPTSPTKSHQPSPKPEASVFWAVLKCTIRHYWAATNPPKVFYNKRGCNFLAVAAATKWLDEFSSIKHLYAPNGLQTSFVAVRNPAQTATKRKHPFNTQSLIIPKVPEIWRTLEFGTKLCGKNSQPYQLQTNSRFFAQLTSSPKQRNELLPSAGEKRLLHRNSRWEHWLAVETSTMWRSTITSFNNPIWHQEQNYILICFINGVKGRRN